MTVVWFGRLKYLVMAEKNLLWTDEPILPSVALLLFARHVTSFNQSECIISELSNAEICWRRLTPDLKMYFY